MSKRTKWLLSIGVITALVVGFQVVAFANLTGSNFQGGDGDLSATTPTGATGIDWNSFDPITWSATAPNTAPYRLADEVKASGDGAGWRIVGKEDDAETTSDTGYAGGTKQDHDCASVIGTKSPNKDDLKRAYLSTKVINGKTFLNLAWVRIPQNTVSASAHVGFEFNQNDGLTPTGQPSTTERCPNVKGQPSPLVKRKSGDMLIVYDFEGSSTDAPVLTLRRWYVAGGAAANPGLPAFTGCEVASNSPPCWGKASGLAAFSEAKVNTSDVGGVTDALSPPGPPSTGGGPSDDESLGLNEFGEASINLSDALPDVFGPGACNSFGKAEVVSRSSGNSAQAQMMDLVGPVDFTLSNCGQLTIIKQTSPRGLAQDFNFTASSNFSGATLSCTQTTPQGTTPVETPTAFTLNDSGNTGKTPGSTAPAQNSAGNTQTCTNVPVGQYTFTEGANPAGFNLTNVSCSTGGTGSVTNRNATITIAAGSSVTCVFTNTQQTGKILIDKVTDPSGATQSFAFTLKGGPSNLDQSFNLTDASTPHDSGAVIVGNGYNAAETVPTGWDLTSSTCDDGSPVNNIDVGPNETVTCTFTNTQRGKILIDKVTDPSGATQSFAFTLKGGPSNLDQSFNLTDASTPHDSGLIKPGANYVADETVPAGWELTSATCSDQSPVTNINVSPGETVTCTFTNLKQTTTISTGQSYRPQDTATITGTGSGTFGGTVDFELYKGTACTGTPVYFEYDVALSGTTSGSTASTTNGAPENLPNHSAPYNIEAGAEEGSYVWKVSYSGDPNHPNATSCVEESSVNIDNDNTDPNSP